MKHNLVWMISVLVLSVLYSVVYLLLWLPNYQGGNDFGVFWSAARWVSEYGFDPGIYDFAQFHAYQEKLFGAPQPYHPFPYPPTFLLLITPLAIFGEFPAYAIFIISTLIFFLLVLAWRRWRRVYALVSAPSVVLSGVIGQISFFAGGLLAGGHRMIDRHPWWAGVFFGLLTIKPQLGLLVPVTLLALGAWWTIVSAIITAVLLAVITLPFGGAELWAAWLSFLHQFGEQALLNVDTVTRLMVSPVGVMVTAGIPFEFSKWIQFPISLGVMVYTWLIVKRFRLQAVSLSVILTGTLLISPYAFFYDLVIVTFAVVLYSEEVLKTGFRPGERLMLLMAWTAPLLSLGPTILHPLLPISLIFFLFLGWQRLSKTHNI